MEEVKETEVQPATVTQTPEWIEKHRIRGEVYLEVRKECEMLLKVWKDEELDGVRKEYEKVMQAELTRIRTQIEEEQKPPTHEDLQALLSQEYDTFTLPVNVGKTHEETKTFTIRELPQDSELKFYHQFKEKLIEKAQSLKAFTQAGMDMQFEDKAKAVLELIDESLGALADAVVIVLNPFGDDPEITRKWVQSNISSNRQWNIVEAQLKVNRIRDFFSRVSLSGLKTKTMLEGPSIQV
jgi:hypothetical protein